MPFQHLYARLDEKTEGRIVQGDGDPAREAAAFAAKDAGVGVHHEDAVAGGRWVELTFPLAPRAKPRSSRREKPVVASAKKIPG